jgi:hypothetical protein
MGLLDRFYDRHFDGAKVKHLAYEQIAASRFSLAYNNRLLVLSLRVV